MNFDPAIAAREAFARAVSSGTLGEDLESAQEAEDTFSSAAGEDATSAYHALLDIGARRPDAEAFQEFLIYSTWQQAADVTIPRYFQIGADLCDRYLERRTRGQAGPAPRQFAQVTEIRSSYRAGLGLEDEDDHDFDKDTFKGGD